MSAECSTCGSDLAYDLSCGQCRMRERAEKAEARERELEAEVERLRARTHEIAEAKDAEHREAAKRYAQLREAVDRARERVKDWKADWTSDPPSDGPEGWWRYTSHNHAMEAVALIADRNDALAREAVLVEAGREALVALAALKFGDVPARHAPEVWECIVKAHDLLFAALAGVVEAEPETPEQAAAREKFLRDCEGKFAEVYNPRPANELFGEAEPDGSER